MTDNNQFSVFTHGYRNREGVAVLATQPIESQDINWAYDFIRSERPKWATDKLRSMVNTASKEEISDFKKLNFQVATFNGIFNYRRASGLVERSPYIIIDIDDLESTEEARRVQRQIMDDRHVQAVLSFVSPKGRGVKGVLLLPEWCRGKDFKTQFQIIQQYIAFEHGICIDSSGSDVCRACFLPHDPECMINPELLTLKNV